MRFRGDSSLILEIRLEPRTGMHNRRLYARRAQLGSAQQGFFRATFRAARCRLLVSSRRGAGHRRRLHQARLPGGVTAKIARPRCASPPGAAGSVRRRPASPRPPGASRRARCGRRARRHHRPRGDARRPFAEGRRVAALEAGPGRGRAPGTRRRPAPAPPPAPCRQPRARCRAGAAGWAAPRPAPRRQPGHGPRPRRAAPHPAPPAPPGGEFARRPGRVAARTGGAGQRGRQPEGGPARRQPAASRRPKSSFGASRPNRRAPAAAAAPAMRSACSAGVMPSTHTPPPAWRIVGEGEHGRAAGGRPARRGGLGRSAGRPGPARRAIAARAAYAAPRRAAGVARQEFDAGVASSNSAICAALSIAWPSGASGRSAAAAARRAGAPSAAAARWRRSGPGACGAQAAKGKEGGAPPARDRGRGGARRQGGMAENGKRPS